ncbi:MAG: asparagine synthase (glutamine-hydrolyzing) [Acidobacteria bacterium]|nr:MAG: asparagine synthase (glutamine-hydrolyzing) [Acidobacteriota bacterium]
MCGILGFITQSKAKAEESWAKLETMCELIKHRGPDERGMLVKDNVALGMQRLSIIDLKGGSQPIFNEDRSLAVIFNGEIYNYRELKSRLEKSGHCFKTNSDTETIVHSYEEFGTDCVHYLRGMFAFAIYDFKNRTLFLARDRVGKKPLFYCITQDGDFVFGSELKVLLEYGKIDREIDLAALDAYLTFGYVPEEFCIFKNIKKLPPGHFLIYQNGQVKQQRYWDFVYSSDRKPKTEAEYIEVLREKLKEAVKVRLISEVPLGAFLSGGIESSSVVAMMSKLLEKPVKTFSIGFNEDTFNELKFARIAAKHFQTDHHEFIVTPDFVKVVDELVWHFDEPFADSSALPTYMVSKMAREHVTVVLSGDGGDELFAGYTRYLGAKKKKSLQKMPQFLKQGLQVAGKVLPHSMRGKYYLYNISLDFINSYIDSVSCFNDLRKNLLYTPEFKKGLNGNLGAGRKVYQEIAQTVSTGNPIDNLLYLDSKTYLPSDILVKVDRMTMAVSLEARAPLLDQEFIEFVGTIPASLKLKGDETKYIFKKAMEGVVPKEILYRKKQGFGVPINEWINAQLKDQITEILNDKRTAQRGYFKQKYIKTLLEEHNKGRRDQSAALWTLWMLELWHRKFIDKA